MKEPAHGLRRSCRLSAAGIRFLGHPAPAREFSVPYGRLTRTKFIPDPDGVVTFRMSETRPGRVPSVPRGRWCAPGRRALPGRHLSPFNDRSLYPAVNFHLARLILTRRHQGFIRIHPSGLPQPVTPGWNGNPWTITPGFAPRSHPRCTLRRGWALRTGPGTIPPVLTVLHR